MIVCLGSINLDLIFKLPALPLSLDGVRPGVRRDPPRVGQHGAEIAAELGYYTDAVEHMQNYLELLPNATDAQSARDQIDLWKFKAGQTPILAQPAGAPGNK